MSSGRLYIRCSGGSVVTMEGDRIPSRGLEPVWFSRVTGTVLQQINKIHRVVVSIWLSRIWG